MRWTGRTARRRGTFEAPALVRSAESADAFHEFYESYVERVLVFFTRRTVDVELAADLTAETFAVALERRAQFRGTSEEEEQGWLFAIARSQLSHYWRHGAVEREALARIGLDPPIMESPEIERIQELAELDSIRGRMVAALGRLPDDQQYCIQQRVVLERPYTELAAELGVSEDVVRSRVSRGLRALAQALTEPGLEEVA